MTFHEFLQTKYPLYSDTEIKVNLTVSQLLELVEEFISETSPVFEVKVIGKPCKNCEKNDAMEGVDTCQWCALSDM